MQLGITTNGTRTSDSCQTVAPYSGEICAEFLTPLQACFSDTSPPAPLNIPSAVDQQQGETDAIRLLNGLFFLNPSPECLETVRPFLCLHVFGLCDSRDNFHTTLREECLRLRDGVCSAEWIAAMSLLPPEALPVCEDLQDSTEECIGKFSD